MHQQARRAVGIVILVVVVVVVDVLLVKALAEALECTSGDPVKAPVTLATRAGLESAATLGRDAGRRATKTNFFGAGLKFRAVTTTRVPYRLHRNATWPHRRRHCCQLSLVDRTTAMYYWKVNWRHLMVLSHGEKKTAVDRTEALP